MIGSILDATISAFSPTAGLRRAQARKMLRQYAGATSNRLTGNKTPRNRSADDEMMGRGGADDMRAWARMLVRDNPYAWGVVDTICSSVVGCGILAESVLESSDGTDEAATNEARDHVWQHWCEVADINGEYHFHELQTLAQREMVEAGECLVHFVTVELTDRGIRRPVPLAIELIEADRMATIKDTLRPLEDGTQIVRGIELDPLGRPVAYWVYPDHPTSTYRQNPVRLPAANIKHLYRKDRIGQNRGVSWFAPAVSVLRDLGVYVENELQASAVASCFTAFITSETPIEPLSGGTNTDADDDDGNTYDYFQPGMIMRGKPGESISFGDPTRPNSAAEPWIALMLRGIAVGTGLSYETVARDYSKTNYSANRASQLEDRRRFRCWQQYLKCHLCHPTWNRFVEAAAMVGLESFPLMTEFLSDPHVAAPVEWQTPGWEWVDPVKEQKASEAAVNAMQSTLADETGAKGKNWRKIIRQRAREKEAIDAAGLMPEPVESPCTKRCHLKRLNTYANHDKKILRMVSVRADTVSDDTHSAVVVIATENPVRRRNERGEVIDEILTMDGVEFRTSRRQLPIVDSHNNSTTKNVLGSVRNIRTDGDELIGDAVFASDPDSQVAFAKLREGHLTDFSITATPNEITVVERGESFKLRGTDIPGPAEIVTKWQPTDASLVATGADERSTVRAALMRSYEIPSSGDETVKDETLKALRDRGMPEDITDVDAVIDWAINNPVAAADPKPEPDPTPEPETTPEPEAEAEPEAELVTADRMLKDERQRVREIQSLCTKAGIQRAVAEKLCDDGTPIDKAREVILRTVIENDKPVGTGTGVVREGSQRLRDAMRDGLIKRALTAAGTTRTDVFGSAGAAEGSDDFKNMGMFRMAEEILRSGGIDTQRMSNRDVAMVALGHRGTIDRLNIRRDGEAYHVTGTFSNLLQDAANKTLLAGYDEAPYTWMAWARQASSVPDFKTINRNRFSEAPNLEVVPENKDYPEGATSDSKESYKVEKYGQIFTVSWETVVNDDLDAISRVPAMHGNAARRKQNQLVYSVITANAAMADTGALFNTTAQTTAGGHANLAGSGTVISVANLNTAFVSMMTKKGLNSSVTINVQPRFLIVPAAIAATALQVVGSLADPSAGGSAAGNSNTLNIYGPNGSRPLQVVADPELDGNSATAWYLAASPSQIDTVELSFLQGEETPVLETEWEFNKDVYKYKIRQTFGAAAIDFRGLYKNPGA